VVAAAERIGYRADAAASLLARRRTQLLGVTMDVSSPFHAELLEHIHASADTHGYDVVVSPLTRSRGERRAIETLLDFRCEGLLLLGTAESEGALADLAAHHSVVAVGRRLTTSAVDVVRTADDLGVGLAVEHLHAMGHHDIAFLDGPRGPIATLRRQGYRAAMRRVGLVERIRVVPGGDTEELGWTAAAGLRESLPTAVVAFNDRCALGLLDHLRRDGVAVPGEVSVVGFDDSPIARLQTVDLTSVSQSPDTMAEVAVALAVDRLEGRRTEAVERVLEPRLVVRSTSGPPASAALSG
jgi:DNA-binding LacI/PurR family transcriptional regulator